MAKKKKKKLNTDTAPMCEYCEECIYVGEGGHVCGVDYQHMVMEDFMPTEDYMWCGGKHFINS